jgi:hypothetical protein
MGTACVAAAATLGGGDEVARTAREAEEDYRTRPRQRRGEGDPPRNAARPAGGEEDREVDSPCFVPGPGGKLVEVRGRPPPVSPVDSNRIADAASLCCGRLVKSVPRIPLDLGLTG